MSSDAMWCITPNRITLETGKDGKPLRLGSGMGVFKVSGACLAMLTSVSAGHA